MALLRSLTLFLSVTIGFASVTTYGETHRFSQKTHAGKKVKTMMEMVNYCLYGSKRNASRKVGCPLSNRESSIFGKEDTSIFGKEDTSIFQKKKKRCDYAFGICKSGDIVVSGMRYEEDGERVPQHRYLILELEKACDKGNSYLHASFIPA